MRNKLSKKYDLINKIQQYKDQCKNQNNVLDYNEICFYNIKNRIRLKNDPFKISGKLNSKDFMEESKDSKNSKFLKEGKNLSFKKVSNKKIKKSFEVGDDVILVTENNFYLRKPKSQYYKEKEKKLTKCSHEIKIKLNKNDILKLNKFDKFNVKQEDLKERYIGKDESLVKNDFAKSGNRKKPKLYKDKLKYKLIKNNVESIYKLFQDRNKRIVREKIYLLSRAKPDDNIGEITRRKAPYYSYKTAKGLVFLIKKVKYLKYLKISNLKKLKNIRGKDVVKFIKPIGKTLGKSIVEKIDKSVKESSKVNPDDNIGEVTQKKTQLYSYKFSKHLIKKSINIYKYCSKNIKKPNNVKSNDKNNVYKDIIKTPNSNIKDSIYIGRKNSDLMLKNTAQSRVLNTYKDFNTVFKKNNKFKPRSMVFKDNKIGSNFKFSKVIGIPRNKILTTYNTGNEFLRITRSILKKFLSNPIVLKGLFFLGIVLIVIFFIFFIISVVVSVFSVTTLKNDDLEISKTYLYVTQLDSDLEGVIKSQAVGYIPHYYLNGNEVSKEEMKVYTDAEGIILYLDTKYHEFSLYSLEGKSIKEEVEMLHKQLHKVESFVWEKDGEKHVDIKLTSRSWEEFYEENKHELLGKDEIQQYDTIKELGVHSSQNSLGSPFIGIDWSKYITSRWGWRVHPITGEVKKHLGLDIALPGGTPVNASNGGTVYLKSSNTGYGNHIKVIDDNGDYTMYAHLSGFAVVNGQKVNRGDVIGYVGTTGNSTGNHLHLEYYKKGENLNPLIFLGN